MTPRHPPHQKNKGYPSYAPTRDYTAYRSWQPWYPSVTSCASRQSLALGYGRIESHFLMFVVINHGYLHHSKNWLNCDINFSIKEKTNVRRGGMGWWEGKKELCSMTAENEIQLASSLQDQDTVWRSKHMLEGKRQKSAKRHPSCKWSAKTNQTDRKLLNFQHRVLRLDAL